MTKSPSSNLRKLSPPSEKTSPGSNGPLPRWKPSGPSTPPDRDHPNYPDFLEEVSALAMEAATRELSAHAGYAQPYLGTGTAIPYSLRQTMFTLTGLSLGAELLTGIARALRDERGPTLLSPEGRPLRQH